MKDDAPSPQVLTSASEPNNKKDVTLVNKSSFKKKKIGKRPKDLESPTMKNKQDGGFKDITTAQVPRFPPLQRLVRSLDQTPDPAFINAIANARMKEVEKYISELDSKRSKHPVLQSTEKFAILIDALRTVNGQKTALISIDLEAFERNTSIVTEIGISIYDPIKEAISLVPSIVNIHLILKETVKMRNGAFVHDHKDNFLGGSSLLVPKNTAVQIIKTIFDFYFVERQSQGYDAAFVGHNLTGDLNWLSKLGVAIPKYPHILDTEKIHSASHGPNGNSLGMILKRLRIPHSFLHNAGNDAYYTLIAALKLSDPQCRISQKLDDHLEDLRFTEFFKGQEAELKAQRKEPKKLNRPRKPLKSHEFSPYIEYFSYEAALMKAFENY